MAKLETSGGGIDRVTKVHSNIHLEPQHHSAHTHTHEKVVTIIMTGDCNISKQNYNSLCDNMVTIKQVRALLSTLAQKKIVHLAKPDRYDPNGFVTVANEYQADNKLVNVEVK